MKFLTASAIALTLAGTGAFAESHTSGDDMSDSTASSSDMGNNSMSSDDMMNMQGELIRSRDLTGSPIYTMGDVDMSEWESETTYDAIDGEWTQIGEIEDLVLDQEGNIRGIVTEVGGFLDMGDKHVMISVDDLNIVAGDEYGFVTRMTEEQLESMNGVDEAFWN